MQIVPYKFECQQQDHHGSDPLLPWGVALLCEKLLYYILLDLTLILSDPGNIITFAIVCLRVAISQVIF